MGTSLSNTVGALTKRSGAEVLSGQGVDNLEDMVCEPPISNSTNISTAEDEGNAVKRVDAAVPTDDYAGMQLPQPSNYHPSPIFNDVNGNFGRRNMTSFAMSLQIAPTQGDSSCSTYRNFNVIDIIRFLEDRNTELLEVVENQRANYQSHIAILQHQHKQQVTRSEGKLHELTSSLEGALAEVKSMTEKLAVAESYLHVRNETIQKMQAKLMEEGRRSSDLKKSQESTHNQMNAMKVDLEIKLRHEAEAGEAKDRKVQELRSIIQEKDKVLGNMQSAKDLLTSENQKLKGQLALIEQKSAQESLTSGSYTEGHANPSLLVSAGQSVDQAMDRLAKFLYENSRMHGTSLKAPELESFIGSISGARPGDFSRPLHVKHVWGHWICAKMFQGFEHVYFDVPADRTSPLDSEKHALDCFQTFQQKKDVPSLVYYNECDLFRSFCKNMFSLVFPKDAHLVDTAKFPKSFGGLGGARGEPGGLNCLFLDVAKAIWLLHELAFSFNPPARVLRMGWGQPFDKEYHEAVIKDADNDVASLKVVLMLRPGFRVKRSVIKSRVFLSKMP